MREDVGVRVRLAVLRSGKSIAEVARAVGIPYPVAYNIASGRRPGRRHLAKLSDYLGTTLEQLLGLEQTPAAVAGRAQLPQSESTGIGARISAKCNELGLTQTEVCKRAGINSRAYLSRIKRGDVGGKKYLGRIAKVLQCDVRYLTNGPEATPALAHPVSSVPGANDSVASRLRLALLRSGRLQRDIAKAAGVHEQVLTNILTGRRPGRKHLPAIARALGLSVESLLAPELKPTNREAPYAFGSDDLERIGFLFIAAAHALKKAGITVAEKAASP